MDELPDEIGEDIDVAIVGRVVSGKVILKNET